MCFYILAVALKMILALIFEMFNANKKNLMIMYVCFCVGLYVTYLFFFLSLSLLILFELKLVKIMLKNNWQNFRNMS